MYNKYDDNNDNIKKRLFYSIEDSNYPPYDIEKLSSEIENQELYRISIAIAGAKKDELHVNIQDSYLIIKADPRKDDYRQFLHKGISSKGFEKIFQLSDSMIVQRSIWSDGLLCIDIIRHIAKKNIKIIPIISDNELPKISE